MPILCVMDASGPYSRLLLDALSDGDRELVAASRRVLAASYAPYSRRRVGAALRTPAGLFDGCNVENASYGLTLCAERTAAVKAVAAGVREFTALAVATDGDAPLVPCGACRQFLAEFAPALPVLVVGRETDYALSATLADLLPGAFRPEDLR